MQWAGVSKPGSACSCATANRTSGASCDLSLSSLFYKMGLTAPTRVHCRVIALTTRSCHHYCF